MDEKALVVARRTAEHAVSDMADGPLKVKAFEVILQRLLEGQSHVFAPGPSKPGARHKLTSAPKGLSTVATAQLPKSSAGRILLLRQEGFFQVERSLSQIREELRAHGWIYPLTSLSGAVQKLVQRRELRRAMVTDGKKKTYRYVKP